MTDERLREAQRQVVVRWFHWIMNQDDIDQDPNAQADKLLDGLAALAATPATPAPGFEAAQVPGSTEERLREALDAEMMSTAKWLFAEYFRKNYPGPKTIITDPDWHAPKIFAAVVSSLKEVSLFPISSKAAPPAPASERELIARWRKWANKVLASPTRSLETEAQANGWLQCADELERLLTRPEPQEPTRPSEREKVCKEILDIMKVYHEQEKTSFGVDTPGGLEDMCDVWDMFLKWEALLLPQEPAKDGVK